MNNNLWLKKESPLLGLTGSGGGVACGGAGEEGCPAVAGENSVVFDGNDYLQFAASTDFILDGQFTIEFWVYSTTGGGSGPYTMFEFGDYGSTDGVLIYEYDSKTWMSHEGGNQLETTTTCGQNTWMHLAVTRNASNLCTLWLDGTSKDTYTLSDPFGSASNSAGSNCTIAATYSSRWIGNISNLRINKGQCLYTSSFTPGDGANLTLCSQGANADNTKVLCCNLGTATGYTKAPGSLTPFSDPTGSTASPWG